MMERSVIRILRAEDVIDDGDMHLRRALPHPQQTAVGPFVFLDHYRHRSPRGIGDRPHPHAGIEVVSYLLEGGVEHRDSMGNVDRLGPGDAQFIRAGRGMLHAERPLAGRHGLQLWLSLPPELKQAQPTYASFRAAALPAQHRDGSHLVVIAGSVAGKQGPMELSGGAILARVRLEAEASVALSSDAAQLGIYVLEGTVRIGDVALAAGTLGLLSAGSVVSVAEARRGSAEVVLIGGDPLNGEVLFSGPFVMDTSEQLAQARRDYAAGLMGRLDGVPF
jgi:redox-sensitive bicupin YhaK (pirin superfamily)